MFRILNSTMNYLKFLLNSEQKKSDFRPENNQQMGAMTQTSVSIVLTLISFVWLTSVMGRSPCFMLDYVFVQVCLLRHMK